MKGAVHIFFFVSLNNFFVSLNKHFISDYTPMYWLRFGEHEDWNMKFTACFVSWSVSITAKLPMDEQHPEVKSRREAELKERRALYEWGRDDAYSDMPGYIKASGVTDLPKDVQFTKEAFFDLLQNSKDALINLGLVHLFNLFDQWDDFDDYRKVL